MDQPTLPAGSCGTCPTDSGGYCPECWDRFNGERRRRVLAWRAATRGERRAEPHIPTVTEPDAATEVAPRPAAPPARLVCREHHAPVTWRARFRGCRDCTNERKAA